jgi:hypothetical protein
MVRRKDALQHIQTSISTEVRERVPSPRPSYSVYRCTGDPLDMGTTYQFCYPLRPQQIVAENLDPVDAFAHEQPVQAHAGLRRAYEPWDTCTCVEAWVAPKCLLGCPLPTQCTEIADGIMSRILSEVPGMTRLSFFWRSHVYFLSASLGTQKGRASQPSNASYSYSHFFSYFIEMR